MVGHRVHAMHHERMTHLIACLYVAHCRVGGVRFVNYRHRQNNSTRDVLHHSLALPPPRSLPGGGDRACESIGVHACGA